MVDRSTPARAGDFEGVVWPRGARMVEPVGLASRLPTLSGVTVGFLWDSVFRGDEILPVLGEALARRFQDLRVVPWDAFGSTFGGEEQGTIAALPDRLRSLGVDAVVSAVGC